MPKQNTTKSLNGLVLEKSYDRLKLSGIERTIFQRLLGFLIRNDKPFPYSIVKMEKITGFNKRTIFRALNKLEKYRLIDRVGMGKNRKFKRGSILDKILTTVTCRIKKDLSKSLTTATECRDKLTNRDTLSYKKTSLSLKHKEEVCSFSLETQLQYNNYVQDKKALIRLKLLPEGTQILPINEWSLLLEQNTV